jgi:putative membrane protein
VSAGPTDAGPTGIGPAGAGPAGIGPAGIGPVGAGHEERDGGWRRLHPLSPLVRSGRGVLAVLAVAGLSTSGAFGQSTGQRWYDIAVPIVAAVAAVINWLVTRWKIDGPTLRIETGLLRRDSRQLPLARIQAVDLVRPFLARMLGLAELRVRLAGGPEHDGRLAYLTEPAATKLRARLLAAHYGLDPETPEPAEQVVVTVPVGRLIGSVLLSTGGPAAVAVTAGILLIVLSPAGLVAAVAPVLWWVIISASLLWQRVSTMYGFTVAASPDGVRIRRGLLGTVAETIPVARVQAVRMIEPLLWRPFGWRRLEVDVAGSPGRERPEGASSVRKALLAVGHDAQARELLLLAIGNTSAALTKPPRRAVWKAPLSYHYLAAGHDDAVAVTVIGRVRRVTTWLPLAKTQSVRLVQGPWQRRLGLATVHLDAAGKHARAEFAQRDQGEARPLVTELAGLSRSARRRALPPVPSARPPGGHGQQVPDVTAPDQALPHQAASGQAHPHQAGTGQGGAGQAATAASPVNAAQSDA